MKIVISLLWIIGFFLIGSGAVYSFHDDISLGLILIFVAFTIIIASVLIREVRITEILIDKIGDIR